MTYGTLKHIAFNSCNNNELSSINSGTKYIESPKLDTHNVNEDLLNISDEDADIIIPTKTICNDYSVRDFQRLNANDSFNIFHNNINGLDSKHDLLNALHAGIAVEFDIIAVTETSLSTESVNFLSNIELDGYVNFSIPSSSSKGGSTIYAKSNLNVVERVDLNITHTDFECIWVEIKNVKSKNIICGSMYRHPWNNINNFDNFYIYLENIFNKLTKENKELYLCGDFNIDLLKIDDINSHKKFYELLCSYGLLPQIFYPTRECGESSTIIDNIFTNNLSSTILSGNIHTDISDHYSQFVFVKRDKIDYKTMSIYSRDYSKFCVDSFRDDVSIQNFNVEFDDVNHQFNDFYFKLAGCVERHAPIKKLSTKEVKLRHKPWISNELIKMIKIRNKLHRRKKRQSNNENIKRLYNLFRNRIIREMKKSKRDHYNKYFEKHRNDVKKTWNGIRSIINIKKLCSIQLNPAQR